MESVYFVVSNTESPEAIFFSADEAFATGFIYVDAFDDEGSLVISYKLKDGEEDIRDTTEDDYTTIF